MLIANGLHLKLTTKLLSIICSIQIFVLSVSIVSPDLHVAVCHDGCSKHHHENSSENDELPNDEHDCPITIFSQGFILNQPFIPKNWEYVNCLLVKFIEPESFFSQSCTRLSLQRAPPFV